MQARNELRMVIAQYDSGQTDDIEQDLIGTARQAMQLRGEVDVLRAEIVRKEALPEKADTEKASLAVKENLLRAIERKLNWLRRELSSRDPKKYGFLRR